MIKSFWNKLKTSSLRINRTISGNKLALQVWLLLVKLQDRLTGGKVQASIDETIKLFNRNSDRKKLLKDIWLCREVYLITPDEYFLFDFENQPEKKKRQFVGNREKELLCAAINRDEICRIFTDKYQSYLTFKDFYQREVLKISGDDAKKTFFNFFEKHDQGILKVYNSSRGRGITAVDKSHSEDIWNKELANEIANGASFVLEEKVRQSAEMAAFNPDSVNTLRIGTYRLHGNVMILFAALRTGRRGHIVDNGGNGGIFAVIDMENGVVSTNAKDKCGHQFAVHPDSNLPFKGFHIPEWDKACEFVKKLSNVLPEQLYVGWDIAHTDNGWVMIEGNSWSQMGLQQIGTMVGLRDKINETFYQTIKERKQA